MKKWLLCLVLMLPMCTPSYANSNTVQMCYTYSTLAKKLVNMKQAGVTKEEVEAHVAPYKELRGLQLILDTAYITNMDSVSFSNVMFKDCILKGGH